MRRSCRAHAMPPPERTPPFLLVHDDGELVLIAPFIRRHGGPSPPEAALVRAVARHLVKPPAAAPGLAIWIDPASGRLEPATIGPGQIRRRLLDHAVFIVQPSAA